MPFLKVGEIRRRKKFSEHDIAEILLKVALKHQNQKSINLIVLFRGERRQKLTIV
jgi:hypothetical protein